MTRKSHKRNRKEEAVKQEKNKKTAGDMMKDY
jgi:hypothetical protein